MHNGVSIALTARVGVFVPLCTTTSASVLGRRQVLGAALVGAGAVLVNPQVASARKEVADGGLPPGIAEYMGTRSACAHTRARKAGWAGQACEQGRHERQRTPAHTHARTHATRAGVVKSKKQWNQIGKRVAEGHDEMPKEEWENIQVCQILERARARAHTPTHTHTLSLSLSRARALSLTDSFTD